ncbi:MAG TPA: hypothetical protein VFC19_53025 [Candidatus Limnocylindrales bacterium]|nr:hypothetical protein [Candidatus Limnocylindrales bacterium]
MITQAGQATAWDTYQALTEGLLPALSNGDRDRVINSRLGAVVIRIRRYAPMWPHDGPMLLAAADSAVRLLRHGDRADLTALSQAMAARLFALAAGRRPLSYPGAISQNTLWNKRFQLDTNQPHFGRRRNMRHGQQHHEKGICDD